MRNCHSSISRRAFSDFSDNVLTVGSALSGGALYRGGDLVFTSDTVTGVGDAAQAPTQRAIAMLLTTHAIWLLRGNQGTEVRHLVNDLAKLLARIGACLAQRVPQLLKRFLIHHHPLPEELHSRF